MLEFIKNNEVLITCLFSATSAVIGFLFKSYIEKRNSKKDTINSLKKELEKAKEELMIYTSIAEQEKNIDKSTGSIYTEALLNGKTREICGYCWERKKIKIPINVSLEYQEYSKMHYYYGYCNNCESRCIEYIDPEPEATSTEFEDIILNDEDLPF